MTPTSACRAPPTRPGRPGRPPVAGRGLVGATSSSTSRTRPPGARPRTARPARTASPGPRADRRGGPAPSRAPPAARRARRPGCRCGSRRGRRCRRRPGRPVALEPAEPQLERRVRLVDGVEQLARSWANWSPCGSGTERRAVDAVEPASAPPHWAASTGRAAANSVVAQDPAGMVSPSIRSTTIHDRPSGPERRRAVGPVDLAAGPTTAGTGTPAARPPAAAPPRSSSPRSCARPPVAPAAG